MINILVQKINGLSHLISREAALSQLCEHLIYTKKKSVSALKQM